MVNSSVPAIPLIQTSVGQVPPTITDANSIALAAAMTLNALYYNFINQMRNFLLAVQAFPLTMTQAQLAAFSLKLDKSNTGLYVYVSDYGHMLIWSGTGWGWAPGELGSGYVVAFATAGPSPAVGWVPANGAANVHYLLSTGILGTQTVPNTAGSFFRV